MIKPKLLVLLMPLLAFFIFFTSAVSAHTVEKTGTLKITLHIEPNDKPVTGLSQTIDFIYADSAKKFDTANCSCIMSVFFNSKQTYSTPLTVVDPELNSTQYNFPDPGIYQLALSGQPRAGSSFKPFSVTFDDVKVESNQAQGTKIIVVLGLILALAVPSLFILSYLMSK